ncbi:hypothetical protein RHSIM_Rhsim06G0054700 [Rhododendron simsii]|uniref:WRKY domain-containing protein n=1 Tax=Rhododendron simsii TaxID=118357 RepID=A0A834LJ36_RHOSS|nr:hypothetical protein RHSIM_Rhsim06G0054700 [Rhododendron simsii]
MAVELMTNSYRDGSFGANTEEIAAKEAAVAGFQSVEKLIRILSHQTNNHHQQKTATDPDIDYRAVADVAVNKFKKFISLLDRSRTGHARFRRGPMTVTPQKAVELDKAVRPAEDKPVPRVYCPVPVQRLPPLPQNIHTYKNGSVVERKESTGTTINFAAATPAMSSANSFKSSLTGDTDSFQPSMSSAFQLTNMSGVSSAGRPPLSSSLKRKCSSVDDLANKCGGSSGRCHCSKKRKSRLKRVVRVPAVSMKMADIPPDDYTWRKYGQKPIKGSPHPRGYYKCSSVRGCPARKHVERALDDPAILIVTYEGDHNHTLSVTQATAALVLESS